MELFHYFRDFNLLLLIAACLIAGFLYLWRSIVKAHKNLNMTLKIYTDSDDLLFDLKENRRIPCAILRGYIREKNLKIVDHLSQGVLRQTETHEVYERNGALGGLVEEKITIVDELQSVEFGLTEQIGNKWLITILGPAKDFICVMMKTDSDVKYYNCQNSGCSQATPCRSRILTKVSTTVRMLLIGQPITIVGKVEVSELGNIVFGRPDSNFDYIISNKSPEAVVRQGDKTEITLLYGILISVFIGLVAACNILGKVSLFSPVSVVIPAI